MERGIAYTWGFTLEERLMPLGSSHFGRNIMRHGSVIDYCASALLQLLPFNT